VIIASKFGYKLDDEHQGARPEYVKRAVEDSLRRLNTDVIDLYQLHRPDPDTPIADTLGALNDLVQAGKVREIGCSNFSADLIREAEAISVQTGGARFVSVQNEYHLLAGDEEHQVLAECEQLGIAYIPYFPLAAGLLTGKYRKGQPMPSSPRQQGNYFKEMYTGENLDRIEGLIAFAEGQGHTLLELAFAWLASQKEIASVIAGAMTPDQVRANVRAAGWTLNETDFAEVDRVLAA
jgi:aryl-alcohol dehydrogenase-like predicted oxidoreductase